MLISALSRRHRERKECFNKLIILFNDKSLNRARLHAIHQLLSISRQSIRTSLCEADGLDGIAAVCREAVGRRSVLAGSEAYGRAQYEQAY